MKITVLPADDLSPDLVDAWSRLQKANPAFDSPYFRPEFTLATAAARTDVRVAMIEDGGEPVGFFPFQQTRGKVGRPVASGVSDFQGAIMRRDIPWNAKQLLRGSGLKAWRFDHLVASQTAFQTNQCVVADSPFIDLSQGFDAYYQQRRQAGSKTIARVLSHARKAEREIGPLRFEPHTTDPQVFETLVRWKTEQCRRTKVGNALSFPWILKLLERIRHEQSESFSGMLSALYFGENLTSVHFGMRSAGVIHWWFPAYDVNFSRYSPGLVLIAELAQAASSLNLHRIDLGKGKSELKQNLMSGAAQVAEGSVDLRPLPRWAWQRWVQTRDWVRNSRLRGTAHYCNRLVDQARGSLGLHS